MRQPTIATCVEVQMGKGLGVDSGERINKSCTITARRLGRDGEVDPVISIVFNISFQQLVYRLQVQVLRLVNCERLLQDLCQSFCYGRAESNKHVKHVKPSPAFEILT